MLVSWGRPEFNCYFTATKPLDHKNFQQQATKKPVLSPEVTIGGVDSYVRTMRDEGLDTNLNL